MTIRIFDRERTTHAWEKAFAEVRHPDADRRWAVVANWIMDHRVSEDREARDLEIRPYFKAASDARSWWKARGLYFKEEVCRPSRSSGEQTISAYLRPANRANRIGVRVARFDELVHVCSLNALVRRASRGDFAADVERTLRSLTGRGIPGRTLGESEPNWFDDQVAELAKGLLQRGKDGIRQAAGVLAQAMGDDEPPWWAVFSEEIRDVLAKGNPAEICGALGLGHRTAGEWLVFWRYPVGAAAPLYRPTVIEANDSPYHFPSPPEYAWGVTMPLDPGVAACREVLHRPLRGAATFEHCTGELLHLEEAPIIGDNEHLAALRAGHCERLRQEFSMPSQKVWLDRYSEPI